MRINRISNVLNSNYKQNNKNKDMNNNNNNKNYSTPVINTTNIMFEARVDKGLKRFYEANIERMPKTVKAYIENLANKASETPLEAQRAAFIALAGATTIAEVQAAFPKDKELFEDLKDVDESKATRGILGVYRENKELLNVCEQGILASGENFTIWLLKKVFLESKLLNEINEDLKKEINPEFKAMYDEKGNEEEIIHSSTLKALGIKLPEPEYIQSLKYTRSGYSDYIGARIKSAWDNLPDDIKNARNKQKVSNFENWWNSMSRDEMLNLIAEQASELDLLEKFKASAFAPKKKRHKAKQSNETESGTTTLADNTPVQIKSQGEKIKASYNDEDLFKVWSGNNLKIFMASLTEHDKKIINLKREQIQAKQWNELTAAQKTEYINRLKLLSEQSRYAMIDAWNKNPDILAALSISLKLGHIDRPADAIYGSTEYNEHFSNVMTDFWESHTDFDIRWGESLSESYNRVKDAISYGSFEALKRDIMKARAAREKEVENLLINYKDIFRADEYFAFPEHIRKFIDAYYENQSIDIELLPIDYLRDFFNVAHQTLTKEQVESWTKLIKQEELSEEDRVNLTKISETESDEAFRMNRAIETAIADILYECTLDSQVYLMSQIDCKTALAQIKKNYPNISIFSLKLDLDFQLPIIKREIDSHKLEQLYKRYKRPIEKAIADWAVENYFEVDKSKFNSQQEIDSALKTLSDYIMLYGDSSKMLFTPYFERTSKSKSYFADKFVLNFPHPELLDKIKLLVQSESDFNRENQLHTIDAQLEKKYKFLSNTIFAVFITEVNKMLRKNNEISYTTFSKKYCEKLKSSGNTCQAFFLPRQNLSTFNNYAFLGAEQAFADELYKVTKNPKIYALTLEELFLLTEAIFAMKNFKNEKIEFYSLSLNEEIIFHPKGRPNLYHSESNTNEYIKEMLDYIGQCLIGKENFDEEELICILNPDENAPEIDAYTKARLKLYKFV